MPSKEWTVYMNGELLPESKAGLPVHDQGFLYGDAVFDASRTFNGKVFRLKDHIDRLYRSCQYMQLDPGVSKEEMERLSLEVVERNLPLLQKNEDMWVSQRVTRGVSSSYPGQPDKHTLLIECRVIPFAKRARYYVDGIPLITPAVRRVPPWAMSPRAKTHNYINMVLGDLEARAQNPSAWALLLDERGNLAEGRGSNILLVKDGALFTPKEQFVLAGITRQVVMELAGNLGIPVHEADLDLYDAYTADETFLTSTSLCVCPVSSINGYKISDGKVPGRVTSRLMGAFSDLVGMDYVAQYLYHMREGETRPF